MWIGILAGCESTGEGKKAEAPPPTTTTTTAPTGTAPTTTAPPAVTIVGITLSTGTGSLVADGFSSTTITATLATSTGVKAPDGIAVTFTTDRGRFTIDGEKSVTANTSGGTGTVVVPFLSEPGVIGAATIVASVPGLTQSVQIALDAPPSPPAVVEVVGIALVAAPTSLPADGISSTIITATLFTSTATPVPDDTLVDFVLIPADPDVAKFRLTGTATEQTSISRRTAGGTGIVRVPLIAGTSSGTVTIKATVGEVVQSTSVTLQAPTATPQNLDLSITASPTNIPADGVSSSTITAILRTRGTSNPVPNVQVTFTTTCLDPLTVTPIDPCGTIPTSQTTGPDGRAMVDLISERFNVEATVTATTAGALPATTRVAFTGVTMKVIASPASVLAVSSVSTVGTAFSTITATLRDGAGNPIVGQDVTFTNIGEDRVGTFCSVGDLSDGFCDDPFGTEDTRSTDVDGTAAVGIISTQPGTTIIRARGAGAAGDTTVTFTSDRFSASCVSCRIAIGGSTTAIEVSLTKTNQEQLIDNIIELSTTLGSLSQSTIPCQLIATQCQAIVTLTSGAVAGTAVVTATARFVAGSQILIEEVSVPVEIEFVKPPASILLTLSAKTVSSNPPGTATVTAMVRDKDLNPVSDVLVSFSIVKGPGGGEFLSPATAVTDAGGFATTTFISGSVASPFEGVVIQASLPAFPPPPPPALPTDACPSPPVTPCVPAAQTSLTIAGPPATVSLGFAVTQAIAVDGARYLWTWSVIVTDINGNAVPGARVTLGTRPTRFTAFGTSVLIEDELVIDDPGDTFFAEDLNENGFFDDTPFALDLDDDGVQETISTEDGAIPDCDDDGVIDASDFALKGVGRCTGFVTLFRSTCLDPETGDIVPCTRQHRPFPANGRLDPGQSAAVPLQLTTDAVGTADFQVTYLQSVACWLEMLVEAESGGIKGSLRQQLLPLEGVGCFPSPFKP